MGVQGLWEVLEPAGQSISLTKIAVVDGFESNVLGRRAYRIGIDASIWYQHAEHSTKEGANPELRLLFFRLAKLARLPWLVLFVFDGRERPKVKRGSRMGKSGSHNLTQEFKNMIECFGMEWRMARGEAEAELAFLNAQGIIDAIITDDVDAFVFGARTIIRNPSLALTGNRKNPATDASGKKSEHHAMVFTSDRIDSHPSISLTRGGLVLFAMLSGGDYDKGIKGMGPKIAQGLARCGFGDRLVAAYRQGEVHFRTFLPQWRTEVNTELRTNASNLLPHRCPGSTLQSNWPDIALLDTYINPICSATDGGGVAHLALRDRTDMSLPRLAKFCEDHFDEWGYRSRILERFYNFMWDGAVFQVLRRAAIEADEKEKTKRVREGRPSGIREPLRPAPADGVGTTASLVHRCLDPPKKDLRVERLASAFVNRAPQPASTSTARVPDTHPLIDSIVKTRQHLSTDSILEYSVLIRCKQLEDLAKKGITGKHPEPPPSLANPQNLPNEDGVYGTGGPKKKPKKPIDRSVKKIWVAASIMRQVHPALVEQYETEGPPKRAGGRRKKAAVEEDESEDEDDRFQVADRSSSPVRSQPTQRARPAAPATSAREIVSASTAAVSRPLVAPPPPPRPRAMYNVGDINFEERSEDRVRKNKFIFTFTDPCDPDMLIVDDDSLPAAPDEFVEGSSRAAIPAASAGPSRNAAPINRTHAAASGFVDLDEDDDDDELPPSQFTAAQEALMNRVLGIADGGPSRSHTKKPTTTRKRNNRVAPAQQPLPLDGPFPDDADSSPFTSEQDAMINKALGLAGPSASNRAKGKQAARSGNRNDRVAAARQAPLRDDPLPVAAGPSPFTAEQDAMIDSALGFAGPSTSGRAKGKRPVATSRKRTNVAPVPAPAVDVQAHSTHNTGPTRKRAANASAAAPSTSHNTLDDEPLPSMFDPVQESVIDRALGIIGGPSQKRTKASVPRKRTAAQESIPDVGGTQTKRHKTGPSALAVAAFTASARPAASSSQPSSKRIQFNVSQSQPAASFADDIIDISDDDDAPAYSSSSKRAPMARRTNVWDAMPSSSQESRLDDIHFDFDLD